MHSVMEFNTHCCIKINTHYALPELELMFYTKISNPHSDRKNNQYINDKKTNKANENSRWDEKKIVTDVDLFERVSLVARPADATLPYFLP